MNILLIGSGGRENALARSLKLSPSTSKLYASPGNPGIFNHAENANINTSNFEEITDFCQKCNIDLVVVGPEQPLSLGIADYLISKNIKCFGPIQGAAMLESSKAFSKEFMKEFEIPTAAYQIFNKSQFSEAKHFLNSLTPPYVIKADGLAAGKGVIISPNYENAVSELEEIFSGKFGSSGDNVVIEEFMDGEEASIFAICDGNDFITLAPAQDHKRIGNGDTGKNTGGMGAYSPAKIVTQNVLDIVNNEIISKVLIGLKSRGLSYIGCLFVGIMIKDDTPKVVEFNCRFGDPETQSVLSVFNGDLAGLFYSAASGSIDRHYVNSIASNYACTVIMASSGYPDNFNKGFEIFGIELAENNNCIVFQAGTKMIDNRLVSDGGRVLAITGLSNNLEDAIKEAYKGVENIKFENAYFRTDIGAKGI